MAQGNTVQALVGFIAVGIIVGLVRGGSVRSLGSARLRLVPLIYIALALQLSANLPSDNLDDLAFSMIVASFACVFTFAGANIRRMGMPMIALGAALNGLVIAINQGMPVSAAAIMVVGDNPADLALRGKHFVDNGQATLGFLGDVIVWPLRPRVISIGDLILWTGIPVLIQDLMTRPRSVANHGTREGAVTE